MSSRPRRSAAQRANVAITDMADRDRDRDRDRDSTEQQRTMSSRSSRRSGNGIASVTRGPPPSSSPASSTGGDGNQQQQHIHLTVKLPSSKLRQATSSGTGGGSKRKSAGSVTAAAGRAGAAASKRTRGGKKSYVIESSEDEDDDDEEEEEDVEEEEDDDDEEEEEEEEGSEIEVGVVPPPRQRAPMVFEEDTILDDDEDEPMEDAGGDDAEGDDDGDEMDVDAEGDDDEDEGFAGDVIDMDNPAPSPPAIKITKPPKSTSTPSKGKNAPVAKPVAKGVAIPKAKAVVNDDDDEDDDDDEELSELESELEDVTVEVANGEEDAEGDEDEDVDAEGEEDAEGEDEELLSDEDGADTPDLSKLTARQRAKLGDASHEYLKLSDEVQAKKVFTAEELSMRRAEMARRRRNLSDKRNEEVKMETINKLLKKQAPKTTRKNAALLAAGDETPDSDTQRADPMFVRWVSTKAGSRVAVPDEVLSGPAGRVFMAAGQGRGQNQGGELGPKMVVEEVA